MDQSSQNRLLLMAKAQYLMVSVALMCEPEDDTVHGTDIYDLLEESVEKISPESLDLAKEVRKAAAAGTTNLLVEYSRLFIGPFQLPAPPYASCYLGTKTLNNEVTEWVRVFYSSSGLDFDYTIMDLPDHAAVETEFLRYLIVGMITPTENGLANHLQADYATRYDLFMDKHYRQWIPEFAGRVVSSSRSPYYAALFRLIGGMIRSL
jgi:TorA maturation chaperone TorD